MKEQPLRKRIYAVFAILFVLNCIGIFAVSIAEDVSEIFKIRLALLASEVFLLLALYVTLPKGSDYLNKKSLKMLMIYSPLIVIVSLFISSLFAILIIFAYAVDGCKIIKKKKVMDILFITVIGLQSANLIGLTMVSVGSLTEKNYLPMMDVYHWDKESLDLLAEIKKGLEAFIETEKVEKVEEIVEEVIEEETKVNQKHVKHLDRGNSHPKYYGAQRVNKRHPGMKPQAGHYGAKAYRQNVNLAGQGQQNGPSILPINQRPVNGEAHILPFPGPGDRNNVVQEGRPRILPIDNDLRTLPVTGPGQANRNDARILPVENGPTSLPVTSFPNVNRNDANILPVDNGARILPVDNGNGMRPDVEPFIMRQGKPQMHFSVSDGQGKEVGMRNIPLFRNRPNKMACSACGV